MTPRAAPTIRSDLFGGKGEVKVWSLLRGEAPPFTAVLACELAPGGSVGRHVQEEFPEVVLGTSGEGEATVDGVTHELTKAAAVYLPLGAVLSITNRSQTEPLAYVIVKARG